MNITILKKTLLDLRGQVVCWGLGLGSLLILMISIYPSVGGSYSGIVETLPAGMSIFLGPISYLDSFEGFLYAEFFNYSPMFICIFAITAGTAVIVGEETQGTLELLATHPISRITIITSKLLGLLIANGLLILLLFGIFWIAMQFSNITVNPYRVSFSFILLWPFITAIAYLSVLISQLLSSRLFAATIVAFLLISSYIMDALANMVTWLEVVRPIYVTAYYQGRNSLVSDISWPHIIVSIVFILVVFILSIFLFSKRDIGASRPFDLLHFTKRFGTKEKGLTHS